MDTQRLDGVPLFSSLDDRARNAVASMMTERAYPDGAALLTQGERSGGVFVLLEGSIRVERTLPAGGTVDLVTLGPGALFGTLAVLDGGARAASCLARGPVRCGVLPRTAFMDLMDGRTPVALRFQHAVICDLFKDIRATNRRLVELAALPDSQVPMEALTDSIIGLQ
jgi:CRP/FNR family transcriptional regulator, cyclic AMP receptor protein